MIEIKHFKVKVLPSNPEPNSIYFVVADGATAVTTYVTDVCGVPLPLVDLQGSGGSGITVTGTGVTGTAQNPVVNISTFLSTENGNIITLSTVDGKLYLQNNQDNKVVYFYPTLEELGVATLREVTETHISAWIQTQGIVIAEDEIPLFKVQVELYPIYFSPVPGSNFEPKLYYSTIDPTIANGLEGAQIYIDKAGSNKFVGNNLSGSFNNMYWYDTTPCAYSIDNNGVIFDQGCLYE